MPGSMNVRDFFRQLFQGNRLEQITGWVHRIGVKSVLLIGRQEKNGRLRTQLLDLRGQGNTVNIRHIDIQQDNIRRMLPQVGQGGFRVRKPFRPVDFRQLSALLQRVFHGQGFVVHTDHVHGFCSFLPIGISNVMQVPFPISLCRISLPPHICSTRSFTFRRPIWVPSSVFSGSKPLPLSVTVIR